jgi:hypothetical protein
MEGGFCGSGLNGGKSLDFKGKFIAIRPLRKKLHFLPVVLYISR